MTLELHYWKIRGLGEPIRMMLEYLGLKYENKYKASIEEWIKEKNQIGIELHNIPYLVDGDVRLSQSFAIMRYLARKHNKLIAKNELQTQQVDKGEGLLVDLRVTFAMLVYNPAFEQMKEGFLKELPTKLIGFEELLGKRKWIAGELTHVDFGMCEILDHIELCFPGCYKTLPNIKKYKDAFEAIPEIKAYKSSDKFTKFPIYSPMAAWGGGKGQEF